MKHLIFLLLILSNLNSCKQHHNVHALVNKSESGWYVILFERDNAAPLVEKDGVVIADFTNNRIIETNSKAFLGKCDIEVYSIQKSTNGSKRAKEYFEIYPFRYVERLHEGKEIKYYEMHIGKNRGIGESDYLVNKYLEVTK